MATVWIAYGDSVVKCARSQVRPFLEDDEAAHEHVTEHMKKLGERLLQEGDFPYEDITGQDEPPVDSPPAPAPGGSTVTKPQERGRTNEVDPDVRRRMRERNELSVRNNQQHRLPMLPQILHGKRQRETMMT